MTITFLEVYQKNIAPVLEKIDLFLKTTPELLDIPHTAQLLHLSENEVRSIMYEEQIESITPATFFMIMYQGSSKICNLLQREWQRNSPQEYSIEDIAYIYHLSEEQIYAAVQKTGLAKITSENIHFLFSYIPVDLLQ
ncbi:MAG: hypothetical protein GX962_11805 [Epulopiscium sp.]|nr:hypothetical protein [Candidatus Epulonipiscium sp.]